MVMSDELRIHGAHDDELSRRNYHRGRPSLILTSTAVEH